MFNRTVLEQSDARDEVAALKARVAALEAEVRELEERNAAKDRLLSAVGHELRTPLTSLKGYAEFLMDGTGGELSPMQGEFVQQMMSSAHRLERLADDLLDFYRLRRGTFTLRRSEVDLAGKLQRAADFLRPQLRECGLTLAIDCEPTLPTVMADRDRLGQVVTNLLTNAIKFSPRGGTIRLSLARSGETLHCRVQDEGPGIARADMDRLFQCFSQLEDGSRRGGAGLGLSICKALVEAHGGAIGVESEPGCGATFWFTLPLG